MIGSIIDWLKYKDESKVIVYQRKDFDVENYLSSEIETKTITDLAFAYFWLFPSEQNLTLVIRNTKPYREITIISSYVKPEYILDRIKEYLLEGYTYLFKLREYSFR